MGCIEVGSAFPSKFYMLYLIMTDWNMGSPKRRLVAVLNCGVRLSTGRAKYQQPEAQDK